MEDLAAVSLPCRRVPTPAPRTGHESCTPVFQGSIWLVRLVQWYL